MSGVEPVVGSASHAGCACAHCGLPVPQMERRADEPLQFCCGGCGSI